MTVALLLGSAAVLSACVPNVPAGATVPFGTPSSGELHGGQELPLAGAGFIRARPTDPTHWGTPPLVSAIERAAAEVARAMPGTHPLRVGDLSAPGGGRHPRHHSHRTGRDADIMYYAVDASGRPVDGVGLVHYGRYGYAEDSASGSLVFFDEARNWHFVRTLLLDPRANVQWIFCAWGLKRRLLEYAAAHEPNPDAIFRATQVLHQPRDARPHDDHMHLRFACTGEDRANGCVDLGPLWTWLRRDAEKAAGAGGAPMNDDALVAALFDDTWTRGLGAPALASSSLPPRESAGSRFTRGLGAPALASSSLPPRESAGSLRSRASSPSPSRASAAASSR